jgi:BirA family transcriptional regulator, biotin operon repressor / biotin---[acetyl-CoA-carboxylase] ligase
MSWSLAAAPHRRIGHAVEAHDAIGSTNDRARASLGEPGGEGRVILAELQTAGRGRRGRSWDSPAGVNLTFSVAVRPTLAAADAWRLAAAAGLAVRDAAATAGTLHLKLPNDVVDDAGRKVAGILIESEIDGERVTDAVIGIGINVNWPRSAMPDELRPRAASLIDLAGEPIDRVALLARVLDELDARVAVAERGDAVIDDYRAAAWLTGRPVEVAAGDQIVSGVARDVLDDGSLVIDDGGTLRSVAFGEVTRVIEPSMAATA